MLRAELQKRDRDAWWQPCLHVAASLWENAELPSKSHICFFLESLPSLLGEKAPGVVIKVHSQLGGVSASSLVDRRGQGNVDRAGPSPQVLLVSQNHPGMSSDTAQCPSPEL